MVAAAWPLRFAAEREVTPGEQFRLPVYDPLTGILNRRGFEAAAHREILRRDLVNGVIGVCSADIDLFKRIKQKIRGRKLRIAVLSRNPLVTSARKLTLYSVRENLGLVFGVLTRPRRTLRDRAKLAQWYDGRR